MLSLVTTLLAAAPPVEPGSDAGSWIYEAGKWMVEQASNNNWLPVAGMAVMVLVWVFRKLFLSKLDPKWMPLFSSVVGVLTVIAGNLMNLAAGHSSMAVLEILASGLLLGTSASGLWDLIGRALSNKLNL